jgi:AcrR family transcriptional regulator
MLAAAAHAVRETGAAEVSVAAIVSRSGVSRRTFYEVFRDRDDCMLAVFEEALVRAAERVLPAWRRHAGSWLQATRAGLFAFLGFLDEQPTLGGFLLVDSLGAGSEVLRRRAEVVDALVDAVDAGRGLTRNPQRLSRMSSEGLVGAVLAILYVRLSEEADARSRLTALLGQLMSIVVLPYLGPSTAAKEAARPSPQPVARTAPFAGEAASDLSIRLTYRTVMVLRAIAELGTAGVGASNSEVATRAGVADPGQISKLLSRIARAGLIENEGANRERGEANAWVLTPRGVALEQTLRGRTAARPRR